MQKTAIIVAVGEVVENLHNTSLHDHSFFGYGVKALFIGMTKANSRTSLLPPRKLIEVDPFLKKKFLFLGAFQAFQLLSHLACVESLLSQLPISPAVESAASGVGLAPAEIIHHSVKRSGYSDPTVKLNRFSESHTEGGAGKTGGNGENLLDFAVEEAPIFG